MISDQDKQQCLPASSVGAIRNSLQIFLRGIGVPNQAGDTRRLHLLINFAMRAILPVRPVGTIKVESPETVRDRVLQAAEFIPLGQLGTTDDCGYSPFEDDTSTGRDTAFAKIEARVLGTRMAAEKLGRRDAT